MFVNVSGDYDGVKLKQFADKMQDKFEELPEITRAEIVGAPEREIQINIDPYKMQAARVSFTDIENASWSATAAGSTNFPHHHNKQ